MLKQCQGNAEALAIGGLAARKAFLTVTARKKYWGLLVRCWAGKSSRVSYSPYPLGLGSWPIFADLF